MLFRSLLAASLTGAALLASSTALAQTELKNDGFADGGTAAFQSGFVAGEYAASRFLSPEPGLTVVKVQLLFGGDPGVTQNITLRVWDDSGLADEPGDELFVGNYQLTSADDALQELDLTGGNFTVSGPFRVGVQLMHDGLPSVARDDDGTLTPDANFLFADNLGWTPSADVGLTGDWILRAFVDTAAGGAGGSGGSGGAGGSGGSTATTGSTTSATLTTTSTTPTGSGGNGGSGGGGGADTPDDEGGCNCRAAGTPPASPAPLFAALATALLLAARKRRKAR